MTSFALCILSNSHVGALKDAWATRPQRVCDGFSLTFFAAPMNLMQHVQLDGGALVPADRELEKRFALTSGGRTQIEIADFDGFAVVGLGFGVDLVALFRNLSVSGQSAGDGGIAPLVSRQCVVAAARDMMEQSLALEIVDALRMVTDAPIAVHAAPYRPDWLVDQPPLSTLPRSELAAIAGEIAAMAAAITPELERTHGCRIFWQDDSTVSAPGLTASKFVHMHAATPSRPAQRDMKHMNAAYGRLAMGALLDNFDRLSEGRVLTGEARKARARRLKAC
jgi:hypothetical protein